MSGPATGCSRTPSSRWVQRRTGLSLITAAVAMSRARRCSWINSVGTRSVTAQLGRGQHVVERRLKFGDAALPHRDGLDHRNAKLGLEPLGIELKPVALGEIDHVESDDRRQAKLDQLEREAEVVVEVRRVDDDDQRVGLPLALLLAEEHVARDRFVGARGIEAVGAGQVDQLDRTAVGQASAGPSGARP